MKKNIIGISLMLSVVFNTSCTKDNSCKTCKNTAENKEISIEGNTLSGQNFRKNDGASPSITYMNNKVKNNLKVVLDEYKINISTDNVLGMALFYSEEIKNYGQLKNSVPNAILLYIQNSDDIITNCYFRNLDNTYSINNSLTGLTNMIAGTDMINIDAGGNLKSEEIVILFDSQKIPKNYYKSDFQIKTANYAKPTPGGGPDPDTFCSRVPECKNWPSPGTCFFTEHQNGPESPNCLPSVSCPEKVTSTALESLGNVIKADIHNNIYELRDNFLGKSALGSKYIDNYYYTSNFFTLANLKTDFLLSALKFYNSNLPYKLGQMNNSLYQDSILINSDDKTIILSILDQAKQFTTDTRFQNIITSLNSDLNKYTNKKISEIKNDFK